LRLGGCILLELAVGVTLAAGASAGVIVGGRAFLGHGDGEAHAASVVVEASAPSETFVPVPPSQPEPVEPVEPLAPIVEPAAPAPAIAQAWSGTFDGRPDEELLAPLRERSIKKVKFNRGGSSISLRIEFDDGTRAAFKPDQTNLQTIPRKEVAAYRLSRLVGLEAVSPAIGRAFAKEDIISGIDGGAREIIPRLHEQMKVDPRGMVSGELSYWIPVIVDAKIDKFPIDSVDGMVLWKRYLKIGKSVPASATELVPQISTMVAFDFLINNMDRWSGSNAKSSPDGKILYFMDNTLSFGGQRRAHTKVATYLGRVEKFSRRLVEGLRKLDRRRVEKAMTTDTGPYPRLLTEKEIDAVLYRRDKLLEHVDALVAEHGEEEVLAFP
jgi:hypothetical protein